MTSRVKMTRKSLRGTTRPPQEGIKQAHGMRATNAMTTPGDIKFTLTSRSTSPSPSCLGETNRPSTTFGQDDHDGGLKLLFGHTRVAQLVASWHPGCEQMERE